MTDEKSKASSGAAENEDDQRGGQERQLLKRARCQFEMEAIFERQLQEGSFAVQVQYLEAAIASRDGLLETAAQEMAGLRAEVWNLRAALANAEAQLVTRRQDDDDVVDDDDESDLVQNAMSHMRDQMEICQKAMPKRRYYNPSGVQSLPPALRSISNRALGEAIENVKAWVKTRALEKRKQGAENEDENED